MIWSLRTHSTRGGLVEILKRRCDRKAASGPYLRRSPGSTSRKISPCFLSSGAMTLALPIQPGRLRAEIIFLPLPIWRARIADCKGQSPEAPRRSAGQSTEPCQTVRFATIMVS